MILEQLAGLGKTTASKIDRVGRRRGRSSSSIRRSRSGVASVRIRRRSIRGFSVLRRSFDSSWADSAARRSFRGALPITFCCGISSGRRTRKPWRWCCHAAGDGEGRDERSARRRLSSLLGGCAWFVPHFEKMLYDQAQLAVSYLEAYQITGDAGSGGCGARDLRLCAARHDGCRAGLLFG